MLKTWLKEHISDKFPDAQFDILTPPDEKMGDYSVNLAFSLAKQQKSNPMEMGKDLVENFLSDNDLKEKFEKIELLSPGFINFHLKKEFLRAALSMILEKEDGFGDSQIGDGLKINLEFVSANPTGPLTVGNARAASFGDTLGNILNKTGHKVVKEYYINDVGVQVKKLGESVAKRYLELKGDSVEFSEDLYQGDYIIEIARAMEADGLVNKDMEFEKMVEESKNYAVAKLIESAKKSALNLGVSFDQWFSEKELHDNGEVGLALKALESGGHTVEEDGAKWLKMSDDQKAVLVKSDGSTTYLMNDIAYTNNKFNRGADKAINIWGADHHGDVPRLKAGVSALGFDNARLEILLHQLVSVRKMDPSTGSGQVQRMSKRAGKFVLLDELLEEVGKDAMRFFFLTKDLNTHMEFDVDLAKEKSKQNPIFYIQYAYARLNSIFKKTDNQRLTTYDQELLKEIEEIRLMKKLIRFPEIVEDIAKNYQIHHLTQYTYELASVFHKFYEKHRVIVEDNTDLQSARLVLSRCTQIVLRNCLNLMGLSAPEKM